MYNESRVFPEAIVYAVLCDFTATLVLNAWRIDFALSMSLHQAVVNRRVLKLFSSDRRLLYVRISDVFTTLTET